MLDRYGMKTAIYYINYKKIGKYNMHTKGGGPSAPT